MTAPANDLPTKIDSPTNPSQASHELAPRPEGRARPRAICAAVLDNGTLVETVLLDNGTTTRFCVFDGATWRVESKFKIEGEYVVPYSPKNNLLHHRVVSFPAEPLDYGDDADLIGAIRNFIRRFVDLSAAFETLATYYVLLSWVYDAFAELPYLRVRGDFGSGKTRFLQTVGSLCYRGTFASGASTVSPLFRILDAFQGTLVLDESDFRFSDEKAELTKILNNGNARGFPVLRTEAVNQREFEPRAYSVYGPKLIASRGYFEDRALESRCFTEDLGDRTRRRDIPVTLPKDFHVDARDLRSRLLLYRFRTRHIERSSTLPSDGSIEPRLLQILHPLLAVVTDPADREDILSLARRANADIVLDRGMEMEGQLLEVIHALAKDPAQTPLSVKAIATAFGTRFRADYDRPPSPKSVGALMRKRLHLRMVKTGGVFTLAATEQPRLARLYERYGLQVRPPGPPVDIGDLGDIGGGTAAPTTEGR
jgi:hypothetical protein